jgi:hypothetical protein
LGLTGHGLGTGPHAVVLGFRCRSGVVARERTATRRLARWIALPSARAPDLPSRSCAWPVNGWPQTIFGPERRSRQGPLGLQGGRLPAAVRVPVKPTTRDTYGRDRARRRHPPLRSTTSSRSRAQSQRYTTGPGQTYMQRVTTAPLAPTASTALSLAVVVTGAPAP